MKKRMVIAVLISLVLLSAAASFAWAMEAGKEWHLTADPLIARLPWSTHYVHRELAPSGLKLGEYNSIGYYPDGNVPYISYYDATYNNLWLASPVTDGSGNCGTNGEWWCRVVDGNGAAGTSNDDVGQYSSIDLWRSTSGLIRSKLGISYYNATTHGLKYAVYTCLQTICAWEYQDIATGNAILSLGQYSSLHYDSNGTPHIAYYGNHALSADSLFYATYLGNGSGNCGPSTSWDCENVDSGNQVGKYASLDINYEDSVYIAYYDEGNGDLKYAYFSGIGNCGTGDTWYCQVIDGAGIDVGAHVSLVAPQSLSDSFDLAYYDQTNHRLRVAQSGFAGSGNCGPGDSWLCLEVDDMRANPPVGLDMHLDISGYPIIAYQYIDPSEPQALTTLRIARPYSVYQGLAHGNCGDIPPGNLFFYWQCTTIDGAGAETEEADYISMEVAPNGAAIIAYSEYDSYYAVTSLKIAYQSFLVYLPMAIR